MKKLLFVLLLCLVSYAFAGKSKIRRKAATKMTVKRHSGKSDPKPSTGESIKANEAAAKKEGEEVAKESQKIEEAAKEVASVAGEVMQPETTEEKNFVAKQGLADSEVGLKDAAETAQAAQKAVEDAKAALKEGKNQESAELLGEAKGLVSIAETKQNAAKTEAETAEAVAASSTSSKPSETKE